MHNEGGSKRVIVTKELPGERWLQILVQAGIRVEVSKHPDIILSNATIKQFIGSKCDGVIGQLTEVCARARCRADLCVCTVPRRIGGCMHERLPPHIVQDWGSELFEALKQAGGKAYSNYAVGYNNVKVDEATKRGIPVGNTPGKPRAQGGREGDQKRAGRLMQHGNSRRPPLAGGWMARCVQAC